MKEGASASWKEIGRHQAGKKIKFPSRRTCGVHGEGKQTRPEGSTMKVAQEKILERENYGRGKKLSKRGGVSQGGDKSEEGKKTRKKVSKTKNARCREWDMDKSKATITQKGATRNLREARVFSTNGGG